MKKTKLLLAPLLILIGLHAKPLEEPKSINSKIKTGSTIGHYQKPGAPIDMSYRSTSVDAKEIADINISLSSSIQYGTMSVTITLDKELKQESSCAKKISFELSPKQKSYSFNLQVSAEKDGLYYIRLLAKIEKGSGSRLRAFAVPVYIGENPRPKNHGLNIMKARGGENLSVSQAIETIEIIND